jgi:acylphosphatase
MMSLHAVSSLLALLVLAFAVRADEPTAKPIARLVHYTGRVQGVGFRATAVRIARGYPVTGRVRNLADGRVELLVEGSEEDVKKFLEAVRWRWRDEIEKEQIEAKEPTGKYRTFGVER